MIIYSIRILAVFLLLLAHSAKSDTWTDPTFAEMLEESDVIGLFQVVDGGPFKAKLKAVKLFKGDVRGEIWLGGFSNKYGPIDN
jgi:hypothetical protein